MAANTAVLTVRPGVRSRAIGRAKVFAAKRGREPPVRAKRSATATAKSFTAKIRLRPPAVTGGDLGPMSGGGRDARTHPGLPNGGPMRKLAAYRELAKFNRRIAEGRNRVAVQRALVVDRDRRGCGDSEGLLRVFERSLQAKMQYRAMLMKELDGMVQLPLTRSTARSPRRR
jgi:hypothetical protein